MDLQALKDTPPWDWPEDTAEELLSVLRDEQATERDRVLAAEMAGDFTVVNDELVEALLAILPNSEESQEVRARAAISRVGTPRPRPAPAFPSQAWQPPPLQGRQIGGQGAP